MTQISKKIQELEEKLKELKSLQEKEENKEPWERIPQYPEFKGGDTVWMVDRSNNGGESDSSLVTTGITLASWAKNNTYNRFGSHVDAIYINRCLKMQMALMHCKHVLHDPFKITGNEYYFLTYDTLLKEWTVICHLYRGVFEDYGIVYFTNKDNANTAAAWMDHYFKDGYDTN